MEYYKIVFYKQAKKDSKLIKESGLKDNVDKLINILKINPFENIPPYEKLYGDMKGLYSRRINYQHRLVYQVYQEEKIVKVLRMWTHYEIDTYN
jgi:Txe/YoeB family toxin of toxin-antitoxin system